MTCCGLVAVLGAPNAGKSTLVNALVGQKVAIVSPKAQTTRTRLLGVAIEGDTQLLLVDTPGIFDPKRRLDRAMVAAAWGGTEGADVVALVVDAKGGLGPKVTDIAERIKDRPEPKFLILNKVDLADKPKLLVHAEKLTRLSPSRRHSSSVRRPAMACRNSSMRWPPPCPRARGISRRTRCPTPASGRWPRK